MPVITAKAADFRGSGAVTGGVLLKKDVLKNFANSTGKHLCCSLFLIKLQAWGSATLLKTHVFFCEIWEFFKNTYFEDLLRTTVSKGSGKSETYSEPCQRSKMKLTAENFSTVNKKLYLVRCLTEFWICLWHNSTKFANYYNLLNKSF